MERLTLSMKKALKERLDKEAERQRRSLSNIVSLIIEQYLDTKENHEK